jgi:hypothetical protein
LLFSRCSNFCYFLQFWSGEESLNLLLVLISSGSSEFSGFVDFDSRKLLYF